MLRSPGPVRLRRFAVSVDSAVCRAADELVDTRDAHSFRIAWHVPQQLVDAPGLEVSPGDVPKDLLVQTELGHQPLQLAVLLLQLLQPLGLIRLQTAILLAPAVKGLFGDSGLSTGYRLRFSIRVGHLNLSQNVHDLLWR